MGLGEANFYPFGAVEDVIQGATVENGQMDTATQSALTEMLTPADRQDLLLEETLVDGWPRFHIA
jgi:hypothetical protein